jgi:hypothetical protein
MVVPASAGTNTTEAEGVVKLQPGGRFQPDRWRRDSASLLQNRFVLLFRPSVSGRWAAARHRTLKHTIFTSTDVGTCRSRAIERRPLPHSDRLILSISVRSDETSVMSYKRTTKTRGEIGKERAPGSGARRPGYAMARALLRCSRRSRHLSSHRSQVGPAPERPSFLLAARALWLSQRDGSTLEPLSFRYSDTALI